MRKIFGLLLAIWFPLLCVPLRVLPSAGLDIRVTPSEIGQGEVSLLTIRNPGEGRPRVIWMGKRVALIGDKRKATWSGFICADLTTQPGRYKLQINMGDDDNPCSKTISVLSKDHGIRRLTVPEEMLVLDALTLKRVRGEARTVRTVLMSSDERPLWSGRWIMPVRGAVVSPFGCRSIINGVERSPHSGVDLRAAEGTPVLVSNTGRVVLVADHFFSGLGVILDHGGGIHSMYFHLSKAFARIGQLLEKGSTLGLSGSTGRVTGPHVHFGIKLNGRRVNPINLIEISRRLER
jgi:hypothetical protein